MLQFYFLSVIFNFLGGLLLSAEFLMDRIPRVSPFADFFTENPAYKFILACCCFFTGIFKLLSSIEGDVPVAGDLLPALSGMLTGFLLAYDYYKNKSDNLSPLAEKIEAVLVRNKTGFGIAGMIIAVIHFIFPRILFL